MLWDRHFPLQRVCCLLMLRQHTQTRAHTRTYGWDSTVSVIMHTVGIKDI